jgi:glucose-6-phosphate isomerase
MKEVLMNPTAPGPAIHYYMIRGGVDQKNITVWEPGLVGEEYIKTYGHYHVGSLDETYWILYGEGVAVTQKLSTNSDGTFIHDVVDEFTAKIVKQGESMYMAPSFGHLFANVGTTYFVTADTSPVNFEKKDEASLPGHADYKLVQEMQGFAFYVVEFNGKPSLKRNPKYKEVKKIETNGIPILEN